jgi:hypothetical protein
MKISVDVGGVGGEPTRSHVTRNTSLRTMSFVDVVRSRRVIVVNVLRFVGIC